MAGSKTIVIRRMSNSMGSLFLKVWRHWWIWHLLDMEQPFVHQFTRRMNLCAEFPRKKSINLYWMIRSFPRPEPLCIWKRGIYRRLHWILSKLPNKILTSNSFRLLRYNIKLFAIVWYFAYNLTKHKNKTIWKNI